MKRKNFLTLMLLITALNVAIGQTAVKLKTTKNQHNSFSVQQDKATESVYSIHISDFNLIKIKAGNSEYIDIQKEGLYKSYEVGKPSLPKISKLISVEPGTNISFERIGGKTELISFSDFGLKNELVPAQRSVAKSGKNSKIDFQKDKNVYSKNEFYTENLIEIQYVGLMRNKQIYRLQISPFSYNPKEGQLKITNNFDIKLTYNQTKNSTKYNNPAYQSPYFAANDFFSIHKKQDTKTASTHVKYVIVSHPMFKDALAPFVEWKTQKGFQVVEAYTDQTEVGNSANSIKAYLQDLYENVPANEQAPTFVLFVGDVAQMPTFDGTTDSHVTDLYFCEYTDDMLPEVFYGRFSATTVEELNAQINKTIKFEKLDLPSTDYLGKSLVVAGVDATYAPTHGNGTLHYILNTYLNSTNNNTPYVYLYGSGSDITSDDSGASAAIIQNLSDGVGLANYTAHCSPSGWADPSVSISDITDINNTGKYGLMIGNCCESNRFEQTCFGESILRAENKGAVGYIGGSNSTYWDEDFWWATGLTTLEITESNAESHTYDNTGLGSYDRMFHTHSEAHEDWMLTQAQMNVAGNLAVESSTSTRKAYYWEIYHLMGDPSVLPYLKVPANLTATAETNLFIGETELTISTEPYTVAGLTDEGVLISSGVADDQGNLILSFEALTNPGQNRLKLVLTNQNFKYFEQNITVSPKDGPYAVLQSFAINDNGNNKAENAESFDFDITMKNLGTTAATDVTGTFSSTSNQASLSNLSYSFGALNTEATVTSTGAFSVTVNDGVEDQTVIPFELLINDGSESEHTSKFNVTVNAPKLEVVYVGFNDDKGNGDGIIDAGETVTLSYKLTNNGHNVANSVDFTISTANSNVTISAPTQSISVLNIETKTLSFDVQIGSGATVSETFDVTATASNGKYDATKEITEKIGVILENWESMNFDSFAWQLDGEQDWYITDQNVYNGTYVLQSGAINDEQTSELSLTAVIANDDVISFYRKVSSEEDYDYLYFYIDNQRFGEWSGEEDWDKAEYNVTKGLHTFMWVYEKDESVSEGSDAAWIDYIELPAMIENTAPEFSSEMTSTATKNIAYSFTVSATDAEQTASELAFSATSLPSWLTLTNNNDGTATLAGTPTETGVVTFNIAVSDEYQATQDEFLITVGANSAIENTDILNVRIYPNPVSDKLFVETEHEIDRIEIYDLTGKLIKTTSTLIKNELSVSDLPTGVYQIVIKMDNARATQSIVIQR